MSWNDRQEYGKEKFWAEDKLCMNAPVQNIICMRSLCISAQFISLNCIISSIKTMSNVVWTKDVICLEYFKFSLEFRVVGDWDGWQSFAITRLPKITLWFGVMFSVFLNTCKWMTTCLSFCWHEYGLWFKNYRTLHKSDAKCMQWREEKKKIASQIDLYNLIQFEINLIRGLRENQKT